MSFEKSSSPLAVSSGKPPAFLQHAFPPFPTRKQLPVRPSTPVRDERKSPFKARPMKQEPTEKKEDEPTKLLQKMVAATGTTPPAKVTGHKPPPPPRPAPLKKEVPAPAPTAPSQLQKPYIPWTERNWIWLEPLDPSEHPIDEKAHKWCRERIMQPALSLDEPAKFQDVVDRILARMSVVMEIERYPIIAEAMQGHWELLVESGERWQGRKGYARLPRKWFTPAPEMVAALDRRIETLKNSQLYGHPVPDLLEAAGKQFLFVEPLHNGKFLQLLKTQDPNFDEKHPERCYAMKLLATGAVREEYLEMNAYYDEQERLAALK